MFCPKCGKSEQQPETYCRQCGIFLVNFDKSIKKPVTPEQHISVNTILSLMTAIVSLTLAVLLYSVYLGKSDTHWVIYLTAGFLTAMCAWQIQTFWRNLLLRKHFKKPKNIQNGKPETADANPLFEKSAVTKKLLDEADFSNIVPSSIVEDTTKNLKAKIQK